MMQPPAKPAPPRYTARIFPAYRFVPGKTPHPVRDPEGHSYHKSAPQLPPFAADQWQACEEYLYGIDLFNHGYWWEAHEALEAVWVAAGRQTETGLFIQGLIQIAVAHLKRLQGFNDVARRMAQDGLDKMKPIHGVLMGIDVDALRHEVRAYGADSRRPPVVIGLTLNEP